MLWRSSPDEIADFGTARVVQKLGCACTATYNPEDNPQDMLTKGVGTPLWTAPEVVISRFCFKVWFFLSDIWKQVLWCTGWRLQLWNCHVGSPHSKAALLRAQSYVDVARKDCRWRSSIRSTRKKCTATAAVDMCFVRAVIHLMPPWCSSVGLASLTSDPILSSFAVMFSVTLACWPCK